jgi:hypothetical protein
MMSIISWIGNVDHLMDIDLNDFPMQEPHNILNDNAKSGATSISISTASLPIIQSFSQERASDTVVEGESGNLTPSIGILTMSLVAQPLPENEDFLLPEDLL